LIATPLSNSRVRDKTSRNLLYFRFNEQQIWKFYIYVYIFREVNLKIILIQFRQQLTIIIFYFIYREYCNNIEVELLNILFYFLLEATLLVFALCFACTVYVQHSI